MPPGTRNAAPVTVDVGVDAEPGASQPAEPDLVVGSQRGLEAWRRDGTGKRLVSAGPALFPRFLDDTNVIVVVSRDPANPELLARGGTVESISLLDGRRRPLAKLPPFACKRPRNAEQDERPDLSDFGIQDPGDLVVFREERKVCMNLMDRNINMASVWVQVLIDLDAGQVRRSLIMGKEVCAPPAKVKVSESEADGGNCSVPLPDRTTPEVGFPFDFEGEEPDDEFGTVVRRGGRSDHVLLKMRGYYKHQDGESPSGRWVLLRGDQEDADYIHANLVLFDREKGEVFRIREGRGWPAPLGAVGRKHGLPHIKTPIEGTAAVVGETDVRWLGDSAETELLLVGDLVVRPGRFAFSVGGEIAR